MSQKIIKSTLPTLALGATVSVAQADVLDDAINEAKVAGFSTDVQTRTEKVSSQSEADRLNQEEASRVQALAKRIQTQVQSAKSSDQTLKEVVTTVLRTRIKLVLKVMVKTKLSLKKMLIIKKPMRILLNR